ncbi:MAG: hypothetical protein R2757_03145 [Draconibacterium sp.]
MKRLTTAAIILAAVVFFAVTGELLLSRKVEQKLQKTNISVFNIESGKINFSPFSKQLELEEITINSVSDFGEGTVQKVNITGIELIPFILKGAIHVKTIEIIKPSLKIASNLDSLLHVYSVPESSPEISIENLSVEDAGILIYQWLQNTDTVFYSGLNLQVEDILKERNATFSLDETNFEIQNLELDNFKWNIPNGLYSASFKNGELNSDKRNIKISNFKFATRYKKYEVGRVTKTQIDWLSFTIENFSVNDIDLQNAIQQKMIISKLALIEGMNGWIFRDRRLPFPRKPDSRLPVEMLENVNLKFYCDSVILKDGELIYQEHVRNADNSGKISFNNLQAQLSPVGNIDSLMTGPMILSAQARLMKRPLLKAEFTFPHGNNKKYNATGSLESSDFKTFNSMVNSAASARVKEGRLKRLKFNFSYNDFYSSGKVEMEYENLRVEILDRGDNQSKLVKTFVLNQFGIKNSNLSSEKSYKKGEISFERDRKKSIFNYWWKSVLSGIKDVAFK